MSVLARGHMFVTHGLAAIVGALIIAGCALASDWDDAEVVGTWESPTTGATLVFRSDGTFSAVDYPVSPADPAVSDTAEFARSSFDGTWSAQGQSFIYTGEQLWKGRAASGVPTLAVIWDVESFKAIETYEKQADSD